MENGKVWRKGTRAEGVEWLRELAPGLAIAQHGDIRPTRCLPEYDASVLCPSPGMLPGAGGKSPVDCSSGLSIWTGLSCSEPSIHDQAGTNVKVVRLR